MRNKIREVLHRHDVDPYGVDINGKRKINIEKASDELTQLMCYREVRAFILGIDVPYPYGKSFVNLVVKKLGQEYTEEMITKSIDKIKNEYK